MTAVVALALLTGAFDEQELECEQAVARLERCCPDLVAPHVCGNGCSTVTLDLEESECILGLSCDEIAAAEICERTEEASRKGTTDSTGREEVCP